MTSPVTVIIPVVRMDGMRRCVEAIKRNHGLDEEPVILWEVDKDRVGCPKMVKRLSDKAQTDIVCFLGDDTEPQPGFLREAIRTMEERDAWLVGLNDETDIPRAVHWLASRKLCNERGEFFDTRFFHNGCDDELRFRAQRPGRFAFSKSSVVRHHHPQLMEDVATDEHYKRASNWQERHRDLALLHALCGKMTACIVADERHVTTLRECISSVTGADQIVVVCSHGAEEALRSLPPYYRSQISVLTAEPHEARATAQLAARHDWILALEGNELAEPGCLTALSSRSIDLWMAIGVQTGSGRSAALLPLCFRRVPGQSWTGYHEIELLDWEYADPEAVVSLIR